jgi:cellulose biosynthesis protein BcsQ
MGQIVTFYSYKGGVGRSMALANVAALIGEWGYRTLIIDWDLEAPGLECFFRPYASSANFDGIGTADLLYYLSQDPTDSARVSYWRKALVKLELDVPLYSSLRSKHIRLDYIGAGRRESLSRYFRTVRAFDLETFYADGRHRIEELRTQWARDYDVVLVDSRTGVTDISSICTLYLPDILVLLATPTWQALDGIERIGKTAIGEFETSATPRLGYGVLPIASRLDLDREYETSEVWLDLFASKVGVFLGEWITREGRLVVDQANYTADVLAVLKQTRIPHKSNSSFGETLPVLQEHGNDPASITYSYGNIAALILAGLRDAEDLIENRDSYVQRFRRTDDVAEAMRPEFAEGDWNSVGDEIITSAPAAGRNLDGRLLVGARLPDGSLGYALEQEAGSNEWSAWSRIPGERVDVLDPQIVLDVDGRLGVFVKAPRGDLWHSRQTTPNAASWSNWERLGGLAHSVPRVIKDKSGRLVVFVRGTDGALWYLKQTAPARGRWSNWESLGGKVTDPRVIENLDGRLEVFVLGEDASYWHIWEQDDERGRWSKWAQLRGDNILQSTPAVARNEDGRLEVFGRGANGVLLHRSQVEPGLDTWSGWMSLGGGVRDPEVLRTGDGRLQVFVRGNENGLWSLSQLGSSGSWGNWKPLGGIIQEAPTLALNAESHMQVFVRGMDGRLWRRFG